MSLNHDPARDARSFAREQRFALASLGPGHREEAVRIAIAGDGRILLGNDVPVVANSRKPTRLVTGVRNCFSCFEGQVAPSFEQADRRRFRSLHPGFHLKWSIEPDLVTWHCVDRGPHAFLASEWLVEELPRDEEIAELIDRVNRVHRPILEALVEEFSPHDGHGARLVDLDLEGLLLDTRTQLLHLPFEAISPMARDVVQALVRLVRNASGLAPASSAGFADPLGPRRVEPVLDIAKAPRLALVRPWK